MDSRKVIIVQIFVFFSFLGCDQYSHVGFYILSGTLGEFSKGIIYKNACRICEAQGIVQNPGTSDSRACYHLVIG